METLTNSTIRELSSSEIDEVNGGILPVIGFGLAVASHVGVGGAATTVLGHIMSGIGLGMATYGMASYFGRYRSGGRRPRRNNKVL